VSTSPFAPESRALRPVGLCTVTFRDLTPARVIELAVGAGVTHLEWGGDIHVPAGDAARAAVVGAMTRAAGLTVASYGSYFRGEGDLAPHLASAASLGAQRMLVWAGSSGSREAEREHVVGALREACARASGEGIRLALEFHDGTLTDTAASAARLVDELGGAASLYWQPPVGMPAAEALDGYRMLRPHLSAVHVFSWWPTHRERHRLRERADLWGAVLNDLPRGVVPFIEFLPGDDPALLEDEVAAVREWLSP
jgi:3-dehydroshikimate dehydratase